MPICQKCQNRTPLLNLRHGTCEDCRKRDEALARALDMAAQADQQHTESAALGRIILTTESNHDLRIAERLDIITAECVLGLNAWRDLGAGVRDIWGGRNHSYQLQLQEARKTVLTELRREAHELGADAVVAVDLDYSEISGGGKSMLFLVASGTAVRLHAQARDVI